MITFFYKPNRETIEHIKRNKLFNDCRIDVMEVDDERYYALIPYTEDDSEPEEYIVLRGEKDENGEEILVSIEDDEEFDRIADIFDDEFADIDYDMEPEDE